MWLSNVTKMSNIRYIKFIYHNILFDILYNLNNELLKLSNVTKISNTRDTKLCKILLDILYIIILGIQLAH